jgi:hypothetical protein
MVLKSNVSDVLTHQFREPHVREGLRAHPASQRAIGHGRGLKDSQYCFD